MSGNRLGDTSQQKSFEAVSAVRTKYNQVGTASFGFLENCPARIAAHGSCIVDIQTCGR